MSQQVAIVIAGILIAIAILMTSFAPRPDTYVRDGNLIINTATGQVWQNQGRGGEGKPLSWEKLPPLD